MRSSPTAVTVLFLIMLLLVVAAGFVFLFQTELRFRDELRSLSAENDSLRTSQASTELGLVGAVATRDALSASLAVAEGDTRELEGQLVESQQTVDTLTGQVASLNTELDALREEINTLEGEQEGQKPEARIISPADKSRLPISHPVEIMIVAADNVGLESVTFEVNGRRFATYSVGGDRLYTRTLTWNAPQQEGDAVFTVRAVNRNGATSQPQSITVTLTDIESRNNILRAEIETAISELRGLELVTPIEPTLISRAELNDRFADEFAAETTAEDVRRNVLALSAFDFLERDYDLYSAQLSLYGGNVSGFYDPETAEFVVVNDGALMDSASQLTHGHEFVHALQDQNFDLGDLNNDSLDSEARIAIRALAEGEASMMTYLLVNASDFYTRTELDALFDTYNETDGSLSDFPPILTDSLSFPYTKGMSFALELYRSGGTAALDAAWANPPRSTEQIMHVDRYRAGDTPQIVTSEPLTDTLGAGWELIDDGTFGEYYLNAYLQQQLPTTAAKRAAAGWGGDHYVVFWNEDEEALVMALRLVWDTPDDAIEFAAAYPFYAGSLFKVNGQPQPDGSNCWLGDDVICFLQSGEESLVVRAPDTTTAATVIQTLLAGAP